MPDLEQNTSIPRLESRLASLEELLTALERTVIEQSEQLERSREGESQLAAIVRSADAAIISLSLDLRILSWNAAAERLFGYTASEMIGWLPTDLFAADVNKELALGEFFNGRETSPRSIPSDRHLEKLVRRK